MNQIHYPTGNATYPFEGLLRFFGAFRWFGLSVRPESREEKLSPTPRCDCGGYNEAFMMQHWANYDPGR